MPQVRCPNCGFTTNLENRKKMDFELIKSAAKRSPRTFTDLLYVTKLPNAFQNKKFRTSLILISLAFFFCGSAYVLALSTPSPSIQEAPKVIGDFTMVLKVNNVSDLYGWQVAIVYNSSQMKVLKITSGGFVGDDFPLFVNSTDSFENLLLIAGSLLGDVGGKNGSGILATITFAYYTEDYVIPYIAFDQAFETILLNSKVEAIPIDESTLTLTVLNEP
jgi:hypothetical protein